jgi:hypothetical protein
MAIYSMNDVRNVGLAMKDHMLYDVLLVAHPAHQVVCVYIATLITAQDGIVIKRLVLPFAIFGAAVTI